MGVFGRPFFLPFRDKTIMNESDFTQAVHKRLPPTVKAWKIKDDYQGGVADAFYRRRDGNKGTPLWVEYKYLKKLPVRASTLIVPDLSELQKQWLSEAEAAGEQVQVIVGYGSQGTVFTLAEALAGINRSEFELRLKDYKTLASFIAEKVFLFNGS